MTQQKFSRGLCIRFEVFTAVTITNTFYGDMATLCTSCEGRRFGGTVFSMKICGFPLFAARVYHTAEAVARGSYKNYAASPCPKRQPLSRCYMLCSKKCINYSEITSVETSSYLCLLQLKPCCFTDYCQKVAFFLNYLPVLIILFNYRFTTCKHNTNCKVNQVLGAEILLGGS
jgi:hypothetical protein